MSNSTPPESGLDPEDWDAFRAMARISSEKGHLLDGLERAHSLAFDLHKWMYQQYDIGCALVREPQAHRGTSAITPAYLTRFERGLAGGPISTRWWKEQRRLARNS